MDHVVLEARKRSETGTRAARRLRADGEVPAILYGHKTANVNLAVDADELASVLRHGQRLVTLRTRDGEEPALVKEVQHDAFNSEIVHVDFTRVSLDERVSVAVPVETRGHSRGEHEGGMLELLVKELHLDCPVVSIPEQVHVDVSDLGIHDTLQAAAVMLPAGTKLLDPEDLPVVVVHPPRKVEEVEEEAEEEAAEEPEVIGGKAQQAPEASEEE